jgi:hypothetical protein
LYSIFQTAKVEIETTGAFSRSTETKMYKNRFLIVLGLLSLLLVAMAVVLPPANVPTSSALKRGREAYAARWTSMGEYYQSRAIDEAERQSSRAADAARWTAMGEYYENQTQRQRSRSADLARWTAMGAYYQGLDSVSTISRAQAADAARWSAVGEYYQQIAETEVRALQRSRAADAARWTAMAEYYAQLISAAP